VRAKKYQLFAAKPAGLGLGRFIVSEIAKTHGGTMNVVSTAERTSFVFFTLTA